MTSQMSDMLTSFKPPQRTPDEWAAIRKAIEDDERKEAERQTVSRIIESRIPKRYFGASLESCEQSIQEWAAEPSDEGLLIQGSNGVGKTYAACCVLKANACRGTILFSTAKDIIDDCKASFNSGVSEKDVTARYTAVDMLCIDDLGKERLTDWSLPILFQIIDKRYNAMKPTIITTNCDGRTLFARMVTDDDDLSTARAIVSRMAAYKRVVMEGRDRRL